MRLLLALAVLAHAGPLRPLAPVSRNFDGARPSMRQTLRSEIDFRDVELVRRNHAIGLHDSRDMRLQPWISTGKNAAVGLDAEGRAFHVVRVEDRTLGFLLSGSRRLKDLQLSEDGALFAEAFDGTRLQFSQELWETSPLPSVLKSAASGLGLSAAAVAATHWLLTGTLAPADASAAFAVGMGIFSAILAQAYRAAADYERRNADTDGFIPLQPSRWRPDWARDWDVRPEHAKLPRGIHPRAWEPEL